MKKLLCLILTITCLFIMPFDVNASSATVRATAASSRVNLGSSVKVTVTVSGTAAIGSWQFNVVYDTSRLQLTSTTNSTYIVDYGDGTQTRATYTYTFKTKALGNASVSIKNASVIDYKTVNEMSVTTSGCTIQVANFSSNASLSALSVTGGTLSPAFNADTTAYNVSLANTVKEVTIAATAADSNADVGGAGTFAVIEGENKFSVTVTAEDGTNKTYAITVDISEKNPITVKIDKKSYTVVRNAGKIETPVGYKATTVTIDKNEIAAYESEITNLTLVVLKDEDGAFVLATYEAGKYELYQQLTSTDIVLCILEPAKSVEIPSGYEKTTVTINDIKIDAWKLKDTKKTTFYLIYGMDVETGGKGFYQYDSKDKTLQRFNNDQAEDLQKVVANNVYIIALCGLLIVASVGINIFQMLKLNKINRKIKRAKEKHLAESKKASD